MAHDRCDQSLAGQGDDFKAAAEIGFAGYAKRQAVVNPTTTISFNLPLSQKISIVVFDVLGRKVSTLVDNQRFNPGKNIVTWNGTNQQGDLVSSGIYFYQVSSDNYKATRKMVLMK